MAEHRGRVVKNTGDGMLAKFSSVVDAVRSLLACASAQLRDVLLERTMRVQANFAEYVPITLLLATFMEMQGTRAWLIHLLCLALVAGRVVHAYGVS